MADDPEFSVQVQLDNARWFNLLMQIKRFINHIVHPVDDLS